MYLTYDEYEEMGGTLDETIYNILEFDARSYINWLTYNRLINEEKQSEQVKRCVYELINLINSKRVALLPADDNTEAEVKSIANDGVQVTYNTLSASALFNSFKKEVASMVNTYLFGVKNKLGQFVLYRGFYENE